MAINFPTWAKIGEVIKDTANESVKWGKDYGWPMVTDNKKKIIGTTAGAALLAAGLLINPCNGGDGTDGDTPSEQGVDNSRGSSNSGNVPVRPEPTNIPAIDNYTGADADLNQARSLARDIQVRISESEAIRAAINESGDASSLESEFRLDAGQARDLASFLAEVLTMESTLIDRFRAELHYSTELVTYDTCVLDEYSSAYGTYMISSTNTDLANLARERLGLIDGAFTNGTGNENAESLRDIERRIARGEANLVRFGEIKSTESCTPGREPNPPNLGRINRRLDGQIADANVDTLDLTDAGIDMSEVCERFGFCEHVTEGLNGL